MKKLVLFFVIACCINELVAMKNFDCNTPCKKLAATILEHCKEKPTLLKIIQENLFKASQEIPSSDSTLIIPFREITGEEKASMLTLPQEVEDIAVQYCNTFKQLGRTVLRKTPYYLTYFHLLQMTNGVKKIRVADRLELTDKGTL